MQISLVSIDSSDLTFFLTDLYFGRLSLNSGIGNSLGLPNNLSINFLLLL